MRHSHQDALDNAERRARERQPSWHPMLALQEARVGVWRMIASDGECYGTITIVRRGSEVGYRATAERGNAQPRLVGYYRTLRGACEATHQAFIRAHARPGGING